MRPATSCKSCREHRRKCRVRSPSGRCTRCEMLENDCSLVSLVSHQPRRKITYALNTCRPIALSPVIDSPNVRDDPPGPDLCRSPELHEELVLLYFKHIHDKHHSLFHQPTVESELRAGRLQGVLLYAMMALGARFSHHPAMENKVHRHRGDVFATKAKRLLDITDVSVTTLQACVLLGTIAFAESRTEAEALYYAVANRLAIILDLGHCPTSNAVERQVNIRIWWTLYMIDIWSSTGLDIPRQTTEAAHIQLPLEETQFLALKASDNQVVTKTRGIWAEMVHLTHIWAEIHDLNKAAVRGSLSRDSLENTVDRLSRKLENWSCSLDPHLQENEENLKRYAACGLGSAFAALHLGFHYYNEVLFYHFLAEQTGDASATTYSDKCKEHAHRFCDLLYACSQMHNSECLYVMVGHMLVVTSTVHMHTLLFGSAEHQLRMARRRLERNFELLTELQTYWVKLDDSLSRLKAFHNACLASVERTFRMDRWMLSFLLKHGVRVTDKFDDETTSATPPLIASSNHASPEMSLQDWYSRFLS